MMATQTDRKAWVGCLACHNGGALVGEWLDADTAGDTAADVEWQAAIHARHGVTIDPMYGPHEEWWVMDHEGLPISGECSPSEAQSIAEVCDAIEADGFDVDAVKAWAENVNGSFPREWDAPTREEFQDAYNGEWDSFKDFAMDLAEQLDLIPDDNRWPAYCIDWDWAARELSVDYWEARGEGGRVYVFRNV